MIGLRFTPEIQAVVDEIESLQDGLSTKALRSALVAASKPVKTTIKRNAPVGEDRALKKSIGHRTFNKEERFQLQIKADQAAIYIGPTRKQFETLFSAGGVPFKKKRDQQYKAYWFEVTGTAPHEIRLRKKSGAKAMKIGDRFARSAQHPGMRKNPFITRGWQQTDDQFTRLFYNGLQSFLEKKRAAFA